MTSGCIPCWKGLSLPKACVTLHIMLCIALEMAPQSRAHVCDHID